jgi:hypothetical protein
MTRFELSENSELLEIMKQRDAIVKKADGLQKEMTVLATDMESLKEKTVPIIKEIIPSLNLNEWEVITNLYLVGDATKLEIVDEIEEHKEFLKKNRKEVGIK